MIVLFYFDVLLGLPFLLIVLYKLLAIHLMLCGNCTLKAVIIKVLIPEDFFYQTFTWSFYYFTCIFVFKDPRVFSSDIKILVSLWSQLVPYRRLKVGS